jgi:hypothetical protein
LRGKGKTVNQFSRWFESLMSAISFADADCHDTAPKDMKGQTVLLVLTGREGDARPLKYALNSSRRVGAALEVLLFGRGSDKEEIERQASRLSDSVNAKVSLARKSGCTGKQVIDYIEKRKDILYVVADSRHLLNAGCPEDGELKGLWRKLKCPLVLVSEPEG